MATRLEDVAEPGHIVCSAATHRLIRNHLDCLSLGHRKIKGITQPVEIFRVERVSEDRDPIQSAGPTGLTPLTGRDHEISLLKDRWEQSQEGIGQVVLLTGEPGVGKLRLVHAIKQHVQGQTSEVRRPASPRPPLSMPSRIGPSSSGAAHHTSRTPACTRFASSSSGSSASVATRRRPPIRPVGTPPGRIRPGHAGHCAAVRVAPLVTPRRSLPFPRTIAGAGAGGNIPGPSRLAASILRPQTCVVHRRGPALGRRVHAGVPWAIRGRGSARQHSDCAHVSPRISDSLAGGRPPDQPGTEPAHSAPGQRGDADEDGGRRAGRAR